MVCSDTTRFCFEQCPTTHWPLTFILTNQSWFALSRPCSAKHDQIKISQFSLCNNLKKEKKQQPKNSSWFHSACIYCSLYIEGPLVAENAHVPKNRASPAALCWSVSSLWTAVVKYFIKKKKCVVFLQAGISQAVWLWWRMPPTCWWTFWVSSSACCPSGSPPDLQHTGWTMAGTEQVQWKICRRITVLQQQRF